MKLGALARTIIVLSCFWMAGGTFFIAQNKAADARAKASTFLDSCLTPPIGDFDCWAGRDRIYEAHTEQLAGGLWGYAAISAAFYLVLALILFGLIYGSARWILAARSRN